MKYTVVYTEKAIKSLKKLDKSVLKTIKAWIEKNLVDTENPRQHGKGLTANRSGQWRYRVGDYRILYHYIQYTAHQSIPEEVAVWT